jgi:transposase
MKRTTKHVGLDVHQATTVASVREQGGRVIARTVLPTEAPALVDFIQGMRGRVRVAFEEGTQAQWLHDLLVPIAAEVIVCDLRGERRRGNKGDLSDADHLSHRLLTGDLRPVYHGRGDRRMLQELTRTYLNVTGDSTRVMQRIKSLFRARAIPSSGTRLYLPADRDEWLDKLPDPGARFRAELLLAELDTLRDLRPRAKAAMVAEARRDKDWAVLKQIPFFGPVRVSLLLATMKTPWRFPTKRNLWAYAGLAVVTETSSEFSFDHGRAMRRRRRPLTRGLNRNHNRILKDVFKGAATASLGRPGPLRDLYFGMVERGMRPEMARVTLARKVASLTLRLWKRGEPFNPAMLSIQSR